MREKVERVTLQSIGGNSRLELMLRPMRLEERRNSIRSDWVIVSVVCILCRTYGSSVDREVLAKER